MLSSGIYKITNTINSKCYIGSSTRLKYRLGQHKTCLRGNYHVNKHLQSSWNKYGEGAFTFEVIETCDNVIEREQYWMDSINPEYNILKNAESRTGYSHTDEAKRKISESSKRMWLNKREEMLESIRKFNTDPDVNRRRSETLAKKYSSKYQGKQLRNSNGDVLTIIGSLRKFSEHNNLNYSTLHGVLNGKHSHVKGWKLI